MQNVLALTNVIYVYGYSFCPQVLLSAYPNPNLHDKQLIQPLTITTYEFS